MPEAVEKVCDTGQGVIVIEHVAGRSVVTDDYATAPMKLLCPQTPSRSGWVYISSFGGGLVSGDTLALDVRLGRGATGVVTSQASTKVFHADPAGTPARQTMNARIEEGALLVVAPEPLVCFADAVYEQQQAFNLERGAGLVLLDWFTAGRTASRSSPTARGCDTSGASHGERWQMWRYASRNRIRVDGREVIHDAVVLDRDSSPIDSPWSVGRFNVFANVVLVGDPLIDAMRELYADVRHRPVEPTAPVIVSVARREARVPGSEAMILRLAGPSVQAVQRELQSALSFLRGPLGVELWDRKW